MNGSYIRALRNTAALLVLASCGGGTEPHSSPNGKPTVRVSPDTLVLFAKGSSRLSATVYDASGMEVPNPVLTWFTLDTLRIHIDNMGLVQSITDFAGVYKAYGRALGYIDSSIVVVLDRPTDSLHLILLPTLLPGESAQASAEMFDSVRTPIFGRTPIYSPLNGPVATSTSSGAVFALTAGTATLRAIADKASDSTTISVAALHFDTLVGGEAHACGRTIARLVYCWGQNEARQVGLFAPNALVAPVPTLADTHRYVRIAAGGHHTCGITDQNTLVCWGANEFGQSGAPANTNVPPSVVENAPLFVQLRLGGRHSCGATSAGDVYCWGDNNFGQLGVGDTTIRRVPSHVALPLPAIDLAVGGEHTCALLLGGGVYCWGSRGRGQFLPDSTSPCHDADFCTTPTRMDPLPPLRNLRAIVYTNCGLDVPGHLWCWPQGSTDAPIAGSLLFDNFDIGSGICGIGASGTLCDPDFDVPLHPSFNFRVLAGTAAGAKCGLEVDRVWCWGDNVTGILGNYLTLLRSSTPVLIIGHPRN